MKTISLCHWSLNELTKYFLGAFSIVIVVAEVTSAQILHSVSFGRDNFSYSSKIARDSNSYDKITFKDLYQSGEAGKPELPVKHVKLLIPPDQEVDNIVITWKQDVEIPGSFKVYPAQYPIPMRDGELPPFAKPDSVVYSSDELFPREIVEVVHDGYFDGSNHIVAVAIYPIQYRPKSGKLVLHSSVDFALNLKSSMKKPIYVQQRSKKNQEMYDAILKNLVDNSGSIGTYQTPKTLNKETGIRKTMTIPAYEYVIITTNALRPYFSKFVSWKKRKGLDIGIITTENIYSWYSGDVIHPSHPIYDNPGKIRQYLYAAYAVGTVWALIGGDSSTVQPRYGAGSNNCAWNDPNDNKIPADLYFADFNGDWNVDADIIYGEPGNDYPDYNPEIFVGRLLCSSSTGQQDILNWTNKVINYETNPGNGDLSYLTRSFMTEADEMEFFNQAEDVSSYYPSFFSHTIWKELPDCYADNPTFPSGAQVISEMNNTHFGLWSWFNHGCPQAITIKASGSNEPADRYAITNMDSDVNGVPETGNGLDNLTNENHPAVCYANSCYVAPFEHLNPVWWPDRSLAEGFTVEHNTGGVAFLGNSRNGKVYTSYLMNEKFANQILLQNAHLGSAELISKSNSPGIDFHYVKYSHNLIGCPETEMWTATPSAFSSATVTDNGSSLTVNAGMSGCIITACSGNNGAQYYYSEPGVASYTFSTSVRPLYVTITRQNYIPYMAITGGTFTTNESWFGNTKVIGSVAFSGNATLTINPSTNITLQNGASFTIYGTLNAIGTSSQPITFDQGSTGWSGIQFQPGSSGTLNYCNIHHAVCGVYIGTSAPTIHNCQITNNSRGIWFAYAGSVSNDISNNTISNNSSHGIYIDHTTPTSIHNNTISSNGGHGIYCNSGNPVVSSNTISNNGGDGISLNNSNGTIGNNTISYSGGSGIYCYNHSAPIIQYNIIKYNSNGSSAGVKCEYYSPAILGSHPYFGHNVLHDNSYSLSAIYWSNVIAGDVDGWGQNSCYSDYIKSAYVENSWVGAEYNYWGGGPPTYMVNGGDFYYGEYFTYDPNGGIGKKVASNNSASNVPLEKTGAKSAASDTSPFLDADLRSSLNTMVSGRYQEAIQQYSGRYLTETDPAKKQYVLVQLGECYRGAKRSDFVEFLNSSVLPNVSKDDRLYATSLELENFFLIRDGKYDQAISNFDILIKRFAKDTIAIKYALFELWSLYSQGLNDVQKAQGYLDELKAKYPMDDLTWHAMLLNGEINGNSDQKQPPKDAHPAKLTVPARTELFANYPNPYNPSTVISYQLAASSQVTLKIYDMLGREVATLSVGVKEAGFYSVTFDGARLASGIYIMRLSAVPEDGSKPFVKVKKMVLMK